LDERHVALAGLGTGRGSGRPQPVESTDRFRIASVTNAFLAKVARGAGEIA
jgi:hypothetical protein